MKRNEISDINEKIFFQNYENLFNVYATDEGDYYYNINKKVNMPTEIAAVFYDLYTITPGDTWTLLAHNYYGDVRLWWIICAMNTLFNPLLLPPPGEIIRVLTRDVVKQVLSDIRSAK